MKYENSYGIIPIRKIKEKWQVLLLLHQKGNFWGFPKGHGNHDEEPLSIAQRELKEEAKLTTTKIWPNTFFEEYEFFRGKEKIHKKVLYFLAEVEGSIVLQTEEIVEAKWIAVTDAFSLITFTQSRKIAEEVAKILEKA